MARNVAAEPGRNIHAGRKKDNRSQAKKMAAVLEAYAQYGTLHGASKEAGVPMKTIETWRERYDEFDTACEEARKLFLHRLEAEAIRRAVEGVTEGVYYQGERVDEIRRYSDSLLVFLLKAIAPEKYRDMKMSIELVTVDAIDREIMRLRKKLEQGQGADASR